MNLSCLAWSVMIEYLSYSKNKIKWKKKTKFEIWKLVIIVNVILMIKERIIFSLPPLLSTLQWFCCSTRVTKQMLHYFLSTRWRLDWPGAGGLWAPGDHECHRGAHLCHLPGPNVLPARWDTLGIRVPARCLTVSFREICSWFCVLWQSGQNKVPHPLQTDLVHEPDNTGALSQRRRDGQGEDATGGELQRRRQGDRKRTRER